MQILQNCDCDSDGNLDTEEATVTVHPLPDTLGDIDISYIPYEYVKDGCMHRKTYLAMELAARNMASSAVQIETCDNSFQLESNGANWRMHQTVVMVVNNEVVVIDPLVSDDFLTVDEWRSAINGEDNTNVFFGSAAFGANDDGSDKCDIEPDETDLETEISEMTPFYLENIMIGCSYLRRYLLESPEYSKERDDHLVQRTYELINLIEPLGLIDDLGSDADEILGKLADGPWCPDPIVLP